jgi:methylated-DNA-[protein]-cysteine S-methyltransferase
MGKIAWAFPVTASAPEIDAIITAPFGQLALWADDCAITRIEFLFEERPLKAPSSPLLQEAARQLREYFADPHWSFHLTLQIRGTPFQQRVWRAIAEITPGEAKTYGQLAKDLSTSARAIALACRNNQYPIVIPCHRVVAHDGAGGFCGQRSGKPLEIKRRLLQIEGYGQA